MSGKGEDVERAPNWGEMSSEEVVRPMGWYPMVWCGMVWCVMVWYGMYGMVWYGKGNGMMPGLSVRQKRITTQSDLKRRWIRHTNIFQTADEENLNGK